jgi:DnaJ-class molecular chaperone
MEPVVKKIEIIISCRELVCAQIAKLKDRIVILEDRQKEYVKYGQEGCSCFVCNGTGKLTRNKHINYILFKRTIEEIRACGLCGGSGICKPDPLKYTLPGIIQVKIDELKKELKYLEDQIKNG